MARIIKANPSRSNFSDAEAVVRSLDDLAAEARDVMLDARQQSARILAEARAQADAVCEVASTRGYAEGLARGQNDGYEDGRQQGLAAARRELAGKAENVLAQSRAIVDELAAARTEILHAGRGELLDFALDLAAKIVGRVAVRDLAAARENVRKVLELADGSQELVVRVHPAQLAALNEDLPQLVEALGRGGEVRLAGDESVSPGGAKVHSARGEIDATIETQMANIVEALLGSRVCAAETGRYVSAAGRDVHGKQTQMLDVHVSRPSPEGPPAPLCAGGRQTTGQEPIARESVES